MKEKIKFASVVFFVSLFVTGCAREGARPGVRVKDPNVGIHYNSVGILDKSLKIAVESSNSKRSPTGTLKVWAVLRNRTDKPMQVEGRTQFFDGDKVPVEDPTAWKRIFLSPQSIGTYSEYSTNVKEVGYYYIEIREGR